VNNEENEALIRPFSEEEIKKVVMNMKKIQLLVLTTCL
jgi:hypothetical protein